MFFVRIEHLGWANPNFLKLSRIIFFQSRVVNDTSRPTKKHFILSWDLMVRRGQRFFGKNTSRPKCWPRRPTNGHKQKNVIFVCQDPQVKCW